jgi:hypothetical protein
MYEYNCNKCGARNVVAGLITFNRDIAGANGVHVETVIQCWKCGGLHDPEGRHEDRRLLDVRAEESRERNAASGG